ncbi:major facilitator superfamily domain-containing protein [Lipomyces starkeyi]
MATSKEQSAEPKTLDSIIPSEKETGYLTGFRLIITIFSLTIVGFLLLLDVSVVATAIPKITSDFHSLNDVGWYGAAYLLANCALQPLTGKIYGEFNMKLSYRLENELTVSVTLLGFLGVFELGSVLCGAATSSNMLIIGRAIAGLGGSGLLNGGYSIVHASAPLEKQPFLVGIVMGVAQIGILCGPLLGGAFTEFELQDSDVQNAFRPRKANRIEIGFYINLPCGGLAAFLLLFISVPNKDAKGQTFINRLLKLDLIGFLLFAPAAILFILALEWGGTRYAWKSATIIGLFCGSFGTLLVFVAWQHRMGDKAMIPLTIIKRRVIWSSCIHFAFFMGAMLTATYYLPLYFQAVRNASPLMSGVDLLPSIISTALFSIVAGALVGRIGYYLAVGVLASALVVLGTGLTSTFTPTTRIGIWIGYQIIMGVGRGMGFQIPLIAVQNNSSKAEVSIVNALVVFSQNLGGAIFLSLDQIVFSSGLRHYLPIYAPEVSPEVVIAAGATGIHGAVSGASLPGVLLAYSKSINQVMHLGTGAAGGALIFAFGMGWVNIKKKAEKKKVEELEDEKLQTSV